MAERDEIVGSEECADCEGTGDGSDGWYCRNCGGWGLVDVYASDYEDEPQPDG